MKMFTNNDETKAILEDKLNYLSLKVSGRMLGIELHRTPVVHMGVVRWRNVLSDICFASSPAILLDVKYYTSSKKVFMRLTKPAASVSSPPSASMA